MLPIKVIDFSITFNNGETSLVWQTKDETDIIEYEIERSNDEISFEHTGNKSALNTGQAIYTYNDVTVISSCYDTDRIKK